MNQPSIQSFDIDLGISSLSIHCQEALEQIGKFISNEAFSSELIIIHGKSRYGLQNVTLTIQLERIDDANTKIIVQGKSNDVWAAGAKNCIERFIKELGALLSKADDAPNDTPNNIVGETIDETSTFEKKTGFKKSKLTLMVLGFSALLAFMIYISKPSIYGTYKIHSDDYILKKEIESSGAYIELNDDGTIIYSCPALYEFPAIYNNGTFKEANKELYVNWRNGELPTHIYLRKSGSSYSINLSGTTYLKQ